MAIGLTHNAARSRHAIARVGQAVVFHYRAGYGRVGREPEATVVDDGRLETVHGCDGGESEKRNASKKERKKNGNDENNTEKKRDFSVFRLDNVTNYLRSQRGGGPFQRPSTSQIKSPRPMI